MFMKNFPLASGTGLDYQRAMPYLNRLPEFERKICIEMGVHSIASAEDIARNWYFSVSFSQPQGLTAARASQIIDEIARLNTVTETQTQEFTDSIQALVGEFNRAGRAFSRHERRRSLKIKKKGEVRDGRKNR